VVKKETKWRICKAGQPAHTREVKFGCVFYADYLTSRIRSNGSCATSPNSTVARPKSWSTSAEVLRRPLRHWRKRPESRQLIANVTPNACATPEFRHQHLFLFRPDRGRCKTVIGSRLKRSGMFWTIAGAKCHNRPALLPSQQPHRDLLGDTPRRLSFHFYIAHPCSPYNQVRMPVPSGALTRLFAVRNAAVVQNAPLSRYTRFGIGGPAAVLVDTDDPGAFGEALQVAGSLRLPRLVIGGGTNLVVSDSGFDGLVLRYQGRQIQRHGEVLRVDAGAVLQDAVDYSVDAGLEGLQTMTGIPGYLSGALYGNAGAYGHSIQEIVERVRFTDGERTIDFRNEECQFTYRESIFKRHKEWVILSADLRFRPGDAAELAKTANEIRTIRDAKYPPTMKCAGSIFKNLMFVNLPPHAQSEVPARVVRDGKVPSAWFLEQTHVKGLRVGDIQVAEYHANLIYNDGAGTAADLVTVIRELKKRVRDRFGFDLEEEVQYVGFECDPDMRSAQ
jgi:UDP-N-acetylmuramate dehydrogenase